MRKLLMGFTAALALALPASSPAATEQVRIVVGAFSPAAVTIAGGDAVTWTNTTNGLHQVVSDEGTSRRRH